MILCGRPIRITFINQKKSGDNLTLHLLYKPTNAEAAQWEQVLVDAEKALPFIEKHFGEYPYKQFSFIHGGDGGMEYPMATLIFGPGAWLHEWLHNWYYGMLGTNESLYSWMDEGFTSYAEDRVSAFLNNTSSFPFIQTYKGYYNLVKSGKEEPLTTHADHFDLNAVYGSAAYSKGAVFLAQLDYIVGSPVQDKILLDYYHQWRFKHPNAADFIRVAEKTSRMQLDWYKEYWVTSTKTIDYSIDSLWEEGGKTKLRLKQIGLIPMPIDLQLTFKDGTKELHYIPMYLMFGKKPVEDPSMPRIEYEPWKWTNSTYVIETGKRLTDITIAEIDPSHRMADVDQKNNKLELKW